MGASRDFEDEIWIVLAAFDAGEFIDPQIESILAQTHERWRLLMRDDGSGDDTARRVEAWAGRDPRITVLSDRRGRLGTSANFSLLLECALARGACWVAIADQDDVWLPTKLSRQLACLEELGLRSDRPALVHTDLEVVGPDLAPIEGSLLRFQGLRHEEGWPLPTLLLQNFVTGCTCLVSRSLLELALPIPDDVVMHDWWLALCAASSGTIDFVSEATVRYRQHAASQIGAKHYWRSVIGLFGRRLRFRHLSYDELLETIRQARALASRLSERQASSGDSQAQRRSLLLVWRYLALYEPTVGRLSRVLGLRRLGVRRQDWLRDATLKLKLLTVPLHVPSKPGEDSGKAPGEGELNTESFVS